MTLFKRKTNALIARCFILALVSLGTAGCVVQPSSHAFLTMQYERHLREGYPPLYAEGYRDGCASGRSLTGDKQLEFRQNKLYGENPSYAEGWRIGRVNCQNQYLIEVRERNLSPIQPLERLTPEERKMRELREARDHHSRREMGRMWEEMRK